MEMDEDGSSRRPDFPTDLLVEVLLRLPPNSRRRLRLVCRLWRDTVDRRTATSLQSRAKTLLVTKDAAYVFDDLSTGRRRKLWTGDDVTVAGHRYKNMIVVGTRNGLVCLCDDRVPRGAVALVNPVTGETLALPPLPLRYGATLGYRRWHRTYSFTYHQETGRYHVVHVPYCFGSVWVFALGEAASWRDVATAGGGGGADATTTCDRDAGIVSVDGATYWAVEGAEAKVVAFDIAAERVTPIASLPSVLSRSRPGSWRLTEVRGRLGIAFTHVSPALEKTEVWVMEAPGGAISASSQQPRWSRWYTVQMHTPRPLRSLPEGRRRQQQLLTRPHLAHGEHDVLTHEWLYEAGGHNLYRYAPSGDTRKARGGVVEVVERSWGAVVAHIDTRSSSIQAFNYVETTEPLGVFRCW